MPWTEITRAQYQREGLRFASDMTDAEWALIACRLPARRRLGRPRTTDLRRVVEAILYVLATGLSVARLPNARYVFADRELAHWTQRSKDDPAACPW